MNEINRFLLNDYCVLGAVLSPEKIGQAWKAPVSEELIF